MPSLTTLALIGVAGLVVYAVIRAIIAGQQQAGRDAERATRAQADLRVAKQQGEIMLEQKGPDDAAKRLDNGSF